MTDETTQLIPMHIAELRRTRAGDRHIVFLEDEQGRRLPIWIGPAEATAMALILEKVELPRPGVYQFAASLLAGTGSRLREVRVTELTESTFYAQAILSDETSIDADPAMRSRSPWSLILRSTSPPACSNAPTRPKPLTAI